MYEAKHFLDELFVIRAAIRAGVTMGTFGHSANVGISAKRISDLCAEVVDAGRGRDQIMRRVADHMESLKTPDREFASLIGKHCADILATHVSYQGEMVGDAIRARFGCLEGWWIVEHEESPSVDFRFEDGNTDLEFAVISTSGLTTPEVLEARSRIYYMLRDEFWSEHKLDMVNVFEDAFERELLASGRERMPRADALKLWEQTFAKVKEAVMDSLPSGATLDLELVIFPTTVFEGKTMTKPGGLRIDKTNLYHQIIVVAARRANLEFREYPLYLQSKAQEVVQECIDILLVGGDGTEILSSLAKRYESYPAGEREFAAILGGNCVDLIRGKSGQEAAYVIDQAFKFAPDLPDPAQFWHDMWSLFNPVAYHVEVEGWKGVVSEAEWRKIRDRFSASLRDDFKDNNGVVSALDAALRPDLPEGEVPLTCDVQRWERALAKARARAMEGFPAELPIEFEVKTYLTAD